MTFEDYYKSRVCKLCGKSYGPDGQKCKKPYEHTQVDGVRRDEDWG